MAIPFGKRGGGRGIQRRGVGGGGRGGEASIRGGREHEDRPHPLGKKERVSLIVHYEKGRGEVGSIEGKKTELLMPAPKRGRRVTF